MAKQLNVSLAFSANTNEAIAQIKKLQQELNHIATGNFGPNSTIKALTPEIQQAMKAASQLQASLEGAVNVKTGKLDLGKFSESLQKNKLNLNQYAQQLSALGPIGNKAFLQLAQSISQAEMPLRRSSTLVKELGTTLANTARWQLSSSILHGFMGAVQSAYGYAQDLNESLNNIRIVTGQNTSQMAKFAKEANKAAKALSSTTTEYTNASLIYYQQGLTDQQVKERTDITIKMANVSRQSAEIVSDQLTAVWNNFYDGTKSLEYYADVMTALGAATASSTDEISEGLNKFAAVADTVGLSYEYAASALATVTDTTRQSADVVGTAFKTLFARLQDLELGETLDDGTDLGKYSEALNAVGINIKDVNGDMKSMDNILDELGGKWQSLSKDTQVALAQTVAGTRQYTQLVALMDNWDFFQKNLGVANSSKGALQSQADIYAESWEAASKKVTTALQRIYEELLNDEFFIDLANFTADLLDTIGNIIDAFGGVKGVLLIIGNLVTKIFHDEMAKGLNNLAYNIKRLTPSGRQAEQKTKDEAWAAAARLQSNSTGNVRQAEEAALSQEVGLQRKLMENASRLSEEELKQYQIRMDGVRVLQSQAAEQAKIADEKQAELDALKEEMRIRAKFQASASTRKKETAKVMSSIDSDRAEVEAENQKKIEDARKAKFNAVRLAAEDKARRDSTIPNTQKAGDEAVAAAAQGINEELQQMAEEQAAAYEATLAQRLQDARADIEKKAAEAAATVGKSVDSHTETMEDLGATKGLSKKLASATNQSAVKKMGEKDAVAAAKVALKDISQLKTQIDKLSKKGIDLISAEELKQLSIYEEKLAKLLKASKIDVKELKDTLADVASDASTIGFVLNDEIKASAKDASANAGVDKAPEEYIAVANAAEAAALSQNTYNRTAEAGSDVVDELGNDIDGAGTRMLGLADKITYGSQAVMSFGMVLSSTQGLIDTLFNPDVSGWEKLIAVLTTVGTLVPMVMSGYDAYTKIFQKNTVAAAANAIAQGGSAVATETLGAAIDRQTPKVAKSALTWRSHPVVAIIAGAVLAVVAAFAIFDNILESNIKKTAESAERAQEHADAVKKEADAHNDLITSYKSALKDFEETGQNKEALIDISLNVAEAYGIEGAAVDALSGNYKNLTKKIIEARKAELEKQKTAQKGAITTTSSAMLQAMRAGDGALKANGTYTGLFDNGASNDDEQVAYDALKMGDYKFLKKEGGEIRFTVANSSDPYEMYNYYLELQSLVQNMQQLAAKDDSINLGASEIYQDIMAELQEGKDHFTKLQTYIQEFQNSGGELAAYSTTLSDGQGIFDIDTLKEYEEFEKKYLEYYKNLLKSENIAEGSAQWKTMIEYAETYLSTFEGIGELKARQQAFDELTNENNKDTIEQIKAYYETLDDDAQKLFWTIGIDEDSTIEEVKEAIEAAQAWLSENSLIGTLEITDSLTEKLGKEKKTAADWTEIETEYKKFVDKNPTALNWEAFMGLSQEEQIKYIEEFGQVTQQLLQGVSEDSIGGAIVKLEDAQEKLKQAESDLQSATKDALVASSEVENKLGNLNKWFTIDLGVTDEQIKSKQVNYYGSMYDYLEDDTYYGVNWEKFKTLLGSFDFLGNDSQELIQNLFDASLVLKDNGLNSEKGQDAQADLEKSAQALATELYGNLSADGAYEFYRAIVSVFQSNPGSAHSIVNGVIGGNDTDAFNTFMDGIANAYVNEKTAIEAEDDDEIAAKEEAEKDRNAAQAVLTNAKSDYITAQQNEQYRTDTLDAEISDVGIDLEEAESVAKTIQEMAEASDEFADRLASNKLAAKEVAKEMLRYNKALQDVSSNYDSWMQILSEGDLSDQLIIVNDLRETYGNLLDLDGDKLSQSFVLNAQNLKDMEAAANGSAEAYNRLQVAAAEDIYKKHVGSISEEVKATLQEIANIDSIKVGEKIEVSDDENSPANKLAALYDSVVTAALQGGKSVEQAMAEANALMQAEGFNPPEIEMEAKTIYIKGTLPGDQIPEAGKAVSTADLFAQGIEWSYEPGDEFQHEMTIMVPKATKFTKSAEQVGGGGYTRKKTSEPPKKKKRTDFGERYKENTDLLNENTRAMEEASAAAERLWGTDRLAAMEEVNEALEREIDLMAARKEEAEAYLKIDKSQLITSASKLGIGMDLQFDDDGNVTNITAIYDAIYRKYSGLQASAAKYPNSEKRQKALSDFEDLIDDFTSSYNQYDDTNQESKDAEAKRKQAIRDWQDNNFEQITYKLEFEIEANESDLKLISHYLDKATSSIYDYTEAMALYQKQYEQYADNMSHYENYLSEIFDSYYGADAKAAYLSAVETGTTEDFFQNQLNEYAEAEDRGEISTEKFREGLSKLQDGIIDTTKSLEEQKQALQDYYSNVVSMAIEEIGLYTAEMEQLNSVLDHYSNIMDLIGKQEDRQMKNKILSSRADNFQKQYNVQSKIYEESIADAEYWQTKMLEAVEGSNEYETFKKNWQAAQQAANDAQDQMLTNTQEWAETMRSIIENELSEIADTLEESLTGGVSFDELLTSMERRSSLQEEYLTATNKIYETNKLMRQAQQEIDKTTNTVAKRRLQSFINETNEMQNQNKLSQYELDIQQAKYDLLLAEIALEEAQNAKSTVRLQRDAEGNFGYVYTADANQVADAEQKLTDAQNSLYNIGLEGANNYAQKYAETLQESQDAITELTTMWMNGEIETEEEFNRRKLEITQYYGEKLQQYSSLQTTALSVDSRIAGEAWSSEFMNVTTSVAGWRQSVDLYFGSAAEQMNAWKDASAQALGQSKLNDLNTALGEVNTKSATLYGILMGDGENQGVVDAMSGYVSAAATASENSITLQGDIDTLTASYGRLLEQVVAVNKNIKTVESPKFNEPDDDDGGSEETLARDRVYGLYSDIWHGKYGNGWASRKTAILAAGYTEAEFDAAKALVNGLRKWKKESKFTDQDWSIAGLATGGYTGDWDGSYGKLAFLHQKELVLNAQDTENFLASMEVLERILRVIDLHSANSQIGGLLSSPVYRGHNNESVVQQDVRIEANFPGVTDRNEIEEAFNNLVNQASQYANRK